MSDSVNDYGLGAPNTQDQDPTNDTGLDVGPDRDLEHGLGTDDPLVGGSVREDGTEYGLGEENTQDPTVRDPYDTRDPL